MDKMIARHQPDILVVILPAGADKHARSRLGQFARWMDAKALPWHSPDMAAYRDAMLADGKAASTVSAHLSTVRARYSALIRDNDRRDELYSLAGERLRALGQDDTPANRAASVSEMLARLRNATDPAASALMAALGVDTLRGLRDTAIIALMLCTRIREMELVSVDVGDLRQRLGGELALHVRQGKGRKKRLIPYGELSWVLVIVDAWLKAAGIESGPVFRGLFRGGESLRPGRLSVRAVGYIVTGYPIAVADELVKVRPHDCRRTYARCLYDAGVDLVAIQQNLGHAALETTLGYIGTLDAERRRAPAVQHIENHVRLQRSRGRL